MTFKCVLLLAALTSVSACGKTQATDQQANAKATGQSLGRVIEMKLTPTSTAEPVDLKKNAATFDQSDNGRLLTLRYKFNSAANTALEVNESVGSCTELKATRLVGPGHDANKAISFKQSLAPQSNYVLEFDVLPSCQRSAFTPVVWIGDAKVKPTRYAKCSDSVLLPLQYANLTVAAKGRLFVSEEKRLLCGKHLQRSADWSGSKQANASQPNEEVRTVEAKFHGSKYLATAKIDTKKNTVNVTCDRSGVVFSRHTFRNCAQVIDDEAILPTW